MGMQDRTETGRGVHTGPGRSRRRRRIGPVLLAESGPVYIICTYRTPPKSRRAAVPSSPAGRVGRRRSASALPCGVRPAAGAGPLFELSAPCVGPRWRPMANRAAVGRKRQHFRRADPAFAAGAVPVRFFRVPVRAMAAGASFRHGRRSYCSTAGRLRRRPAAGTAAAAPPLSALDAPAERTGAARAAPRLPFRYRAEPCDPASPAAARSRRRWHSRRPSATARQAAAYSLPGIRDRHRLVGWEPKRPTGVHGDTPAGRPPSVEPGTCRQHTDTRRRAEVDPSRPELLQPHDGARVGQRHTGLLDQAADRPRQRDHIGLPGAHK